MCFSVFSSVFFFMLFPVFFSHSMFRFTGPFPLYHRPRLIQRSLRVCDYDFAGFAFQRLHLEAHERLMLTVEESDLHERLQILCQFLDVVFSALYSESWMGIAAQRTSLSNSPSSKAIPARRISCSSRRNLCGLVIVFAVSDFSSTRSR